MRRNLSARRRPSSWVGCWTGGCLRAPPSGEVTESPITFESEAEKPTRAPARRKPAAEPEMQSEAALEEELELETELVGDVESAETEEAEEAGANGDETAASKKRTRRGSRGGRRRKKKPTDLGGAGSGLDVRVRSSPSRTASPRPSMSRLVPRRLPPSRSPHLPRRAGRVVGHPRFTSPHRISRGPGADGNGAELQPSATDVEMPVEVEAEGGDGQVRSKPRARRGSRGGRNRRRKTPAGEVAEGGARPTRGRRACGSGHS